MLAVRAAGKKLARQAAASGQPLSTNCVLGSLPKSLEAQIAVARDCSACIDSNFQDLLGSSIAELPSWVSGSARSPACMCLPACELLQHLPML